MSKPKGQIPPNNVVYQQNISKRKQAAWLAELDVDDEKEAKGLLQFFDDFGIPKGPAIQMANSLYQMKKMMSDCILYKVLMDQYNDKRNQEIKRYKRVIKNITDAIEKEEAKSKLRSFLDNFWEQPTCDCDEIPGFVNSWKKNKTSLQDKIKEIEKMPLKDLHKFMKSKMLQKDIDNILKTTQWMAAAQLFFCFQDAFQHHKKLKKSHKRAKLIRLKLKHIKKKYIDPVVDEFARDNGYPNINMCLINEGIDELKLIKEECEIQKNEATQSLIGNVMNIVNMALLGYGSYYQSTTLGKLASEGVLKAQNVATGAYVFCGLMYGKMAIEDIIRRKEWSKIINEIDKYLEKLESIKSQLEGFQPIRNL